MSEEGSYVYSLTYETCQFQLHCDIEMTCPNVIMRQVMNSSSITSAWIIHSKLQKNPNSDIPIHDTKQREVEV